MQNDISSVVLVMQFRVGVVSEWISGKQHPVTDALLVHQRKDKEIGDRDIVAGCLG